MKTLLLSLFVITSLSLHAEAKKKAAAQSEAPFQKVEFAHLPLSEKDAQEAHINLGGFSALQFIKKEKNKLYFKTITDRGPNGSETPVGRPFIVPDFSPLIVEFYFDTKTHQVTITGQTPMLDFNLQKLNGLPFVGAEAKVETGIDSKMQVLVNKGTGIDSEGYCEVGDNYFVSDEYGPFLFKFAKATNKLLKIYKPNQDFPKEWLNRKINRGLEGMTCDNENVYLMLQSPLPKEDFIRIAEFNIKSEKMTREFHYPIEAKKADKVGDIGLIKDKKILVIEQNGKLGKSGSFRSIYKIDLAQANEKGELSKELVIDLNESGFDQIEKFEGVAMVDPRHMALVNDNDFGIESDYNEKENKLSFKVTDTASYFILLTLPKKLY